MRIEHGLLPGHVLQRTPAGASATITGSLDAGLSGPVTATVKRGATILRGQAKRRVGEAGDGRFTATIAGLPAGGPYTVELACGRAKAVVKEVYVGDLWLMAGQSNMEGVGNLCDAPEPHPLVRNFSMARVWEQARDPLHFLAESPDRCHGGSGMTPEAAEKAKTAAIKGAGVGIPFGRLMHERSGVPQGLIATAHGGTSMAQWSPDLKDKGGDSLYGSMRLSLRAVGQPIAGVLWYQGCSDTGAEQAAIYTTKMQELVAAVRADLGQPELPWVIVQIGRVVEDNDQRSAMWNSVQEQQRRLPETIAHCDVVPAVDLDLDDLIHIATTSYPALATRMARVAARLALGDRGEKPAIQPASVRFVEGRPPFTAAVEVRFANVVGGLRCPGLAHGFALVDRQHRDVHAIHRVVLDGDRAILRLTGAALAGLQLMYGRGHDPICNVIDARGMAVPVFGPLPIAGLPALTPWFLRWKRSPIRPGEDILALPRPSDDDPEAQDRPFASKDFVNCHGEWEGNSGHVGFTGHVDLPEDMEVELRFGYDGPFRLWVDDEEVHTDMAGTNPAIQDRHKTVRRLPAGRHRLAVLMALNGGRAWGFFLRMARLDVDGGAAPIPQPWY
ncbi:MAG: sialate O-acetylesterase [Planctomycetes bacterium]|nr:sialate O-acetylesterase [Planctomycetota bacterium]